MTLKGENILNRKDGRWEGRYIKGYGQDGKAIYGSVYGKSYGEAKKSLHIMMANCLAEKQVQGCCQLTLREVSALWLQRINRKIKESTYANYCTMIERHINPSLGDIQINKLTTAKIESFIMEKLAQGRLDKRGGLAGKTVRDMVIILKCILKFIRKEYNMPISAMLASNPKFVSPQIRVLSFEDFKKLEVFLLAEINASKLGILLCMYTGMRLGEICALQWSDICLKTGVVKIRKTVQRVRNTSVEQKSKTKIIFDTPKTRYSNRDIPLPQNILMLLQHFFRAQHICSSAYLLSGNPHKYMDPRTYQNHFQKYLQESGIEKNNFHVLRHTFATRCVGSGIDAKTISEILGHASVTITLNRYVHSCLERKRIEIEKIASHSVLKGSEIWSKFL